jgi:hypothetical protein
MSDTCKPHYDASAGSSSGKSLKPDSDRPTIEQVAWVFAKLNESINNGGCSFRYLIYDLMGFGPEAYAPLYIAGGMNLTNLIVESVEGGK